MKHLHGTAFLFLAILCDIENLVCAAEGSPDDKIHLSVVACGDRLEESLMMIKSTCLFTERPMHYHILADDDLRPLFEKQLNTWPDFIREKFSFTLYPITYPEGEDEVQWKKVFKPCATQRLFIPHVFEKLGVDVSRLLYVDTDILFFTSLDNVWSRFDQFNASHISALTPEHEAVWMGWYNRFARHPYYGEMGVNSGVMWMDLPRIRASNWLRHMIDYYKIYRLNITWGDQDLMNIFFHNYPEKLHVLPCEWNYRPDHCMYGSVCKTAETEGVLVVHGNRGYYHNDKQPAFKAIYQSLRDYKFGQDLEEHLLRPMATALKQTEHTYCGKTSAFLMKEFRRQVEAAKQREQAKVEKGLKQEADSVRTGEAESFETGESDQVKTGEADPVKTSEAGPVETGKADLVETGVADPVGTSEADPVGTGEANPVETREAESLKSKEAVDLKAEKVTNEDASHTHDDL